MSALKSKSLGWGRGSSAHGGAFNLIIVDDRYLGNLTQRATSSSSTIVALPTAGTPFLSGTASRANAMTVADDQKNVPMHLATIKRITGFSWERIGALLGCSRQTVYNWTQGEPVKSENARDVAQLRETLAYIDRGSQAETVSVLEGEVGGRSIVSMIEAGEFSVARRLAGKGRGRPTATWTQMQPQKPSGRQDHWTDRIAAADDDDVDRRAGFVPNKVIKRTKLKTR